MNIFAHVLNEIWPIKRLIHANSRIVVEANLVGSAFSDELHMLSALDHDVRTVIDSLIAELEVSLDFLIIIIVAMSGALKVAVLFDIHVRPCIAKEARIKALLTVGRFFSR